jgi:AraC-like DNA-binding protein
MRRLYEATGMTPLNYVQALKLEEVKQMLDTGDLSIKAMANDIGYEDASFFNRAFRPKVGMTLAQYRFRFRSLQRMLI